MANIFDLFDKIATQKTASAGKPEFIIAGLGNPGAEYKNTRHNAGFLAIETIAESCGVKINESKFKALVGFDTLAGKRVLYMEPQTYMNNSGEAISAAARFYNIPAENIIVLVDDIYQAPGKMRIRKNGSDGGHNGLKSIIQHLSSDEFSRIRIGVGEKPSKEYPLADWVLSKIPKDDEERMKKIYSHCKEAVEYLIEKRFDDAMGKFNGLSY